MPMGLEVYVLNPFNFLVGLGYNDTEEETRAELFLGLFAISLVKVK